MPRGRGWVVAVLVGLSVLLPGRPARGQSAPVANASGSKPDPASVERKLLDGVRQHPDRFEAHHMLAVFYLRQGRVRDAVPHLQRAQTLNPANSDVGYDLARALLETERFDEARAQVKRLLAVKDVGELHNMLGDVEERAGNLIGAAEEYQRAAHMDASEEHLFDWGNNLLQLRAYKEATEVFAASIPRQPKSARLRVGLGIAQYSLGEYRQAVQAFCEAADLAPSDPRPYQFLGEMYGVSPDVSGEISTRLERFVQTHPTNALAHFHYAMSLWKAGADAPPANEMRRIETLLTRAVTLDPKMANGFLQLGILLADQKRTLEAIQALRRAVRLQPDLSRAHYRLAQLYQRTGQKDAAERELAIFRQLTGGSGGDK